MVLPAFLNSDPTLAVTYDVRNENGAVLNSNLYTFVQSTRTLSLMTIDPAQVGT